MPYTRHAYRTPGVYIERTDASRVPPIVLRTDIAAFVGIAERGPLDTPVPIESVRQFTAHFGGFIGAGYLAYVVRAFFENGGRRCWIVRVAQRDWSGDEPATSGARAAWTELRDIDGKHTLRLSASSPGSWGNGVALQWGVSGASIAMSLPAKSTRQYAVLRSVAGFAADELVRIEQPGMRPQYRVIAAIDVAEARLYWVHPDPVRRRASDLALSGADSTTPQRITRIAYALTVRSDHEVVAQYRDLHLVPTHRRFIGAVLRPPVYWASVLRGSALVAADESDAARDDEPSAALPRAPETIVAQVLTAEEIPRPLDVPLDRKIVLEGGADGLAGLQALDFAGEAFSPNDSDFARARKCRGVQSLALIDEIALVAAPDILIQPDADPDYLAPPAIVSNPCVPCPAPEPPRVIHQPRVPGELPPLFSEADIARVQAALVAHCEDMGDRVALLALPFRLATFAVSPREEIIGWRERFDARAAALYAPWLAVAEPRGFALTRAIPPCGHVAGAIARVDLATGVQRAPGNVSLTGIIRIVREIDDELHGDLNDASVNALRVEFGQAPRIGGARSLAYDVQWRYLNVVRLMLTIKKACDLALRWAVFEPNDEALWANVRSTLTAILVLFFERGAFAGDTAEESFFVQCDETTNPPQSREMGQLLALIGFKPAAPCEFIVIRVGRQLAGAGISLFAAEEVAA
jgi:hypothetical protein